MARAIPVLPEVASIRVSPGLISPRASARLIIDSAGRSLTEPAGLLPSSRSEEHTSELQSLMRISYAVFCLKKKTTKQIWNKTTHKRTQVITSYINTNNLIQHEQKKQTM